MMVIADFVKYLEKELQERLEMQASMREFKTSQYSRDVITGRIQELEKQISYLNDISPEEAS